MLLGIELMSLHCAVVGFTLGFLTQLRTGVSVWGQLNAFPFAYLWAYGLVVIGSLLNQYAPRTFSLCCVLSAADCAGMSSRYCQGECLPYCKRRFACQSLCHSHISAVIYKCTAALIQLLSMICA